MKCQWFILILSKIIGILYISKGFPDKIAFDFEQHIIGFIGSNRVNTTSCGYIYDKIDAPDRLSLGISHYDKRIQVCFQNC